MAANADESAQADIDQQPDHAGLPEAAAANPASKHLEPGSASPGRSPRAAIVVATIQADPRQDESTAALDSGGSAQADHVGQPDHAGLPEAAAASPASIHLEPVSASPGRSPRPANVVAMIQADLRQDESTAAFNAGEPAQADHVGQTDHAGLLEVAPAKSASLHLDHGPASPVRSPHHQPEDASGVIEAAARLNKVQTNPADMLPQLAQDRTSLEHVPLKASMVPSPSQPAGVLATTDGAASGAYQPGVPSLQPAVLVRRKEVAPGKQAQLSQDSQSEISATPEPQSDENDQAAREACLPHTSEVACMEAAAGAVVTDSASPEPVLQLVDPSAGSAQQLAARAGEVTTSSQMPLPSSAAPASTAARSGSNQKAR